MKRKVLVLKIISMKAVIWTALKNVTYGGFNPNWFCSDMPLQDQYSCYDISNFDTRTKLMESVGRTDIAGKGTGDINIMTDQNGTHGNSRKISYISGSLASQINFKTCCLRIIQFVLSRYLGPDVWKNIWSRQ